MVVFCCRCVDCGLGNCCLQPVARSVSLHVTSRWGHTAGRTPGWPVDEVAVAEQAVGDGSCSLKVTAPEQRDILLRPDYPWCLNITCRGNGDNFQIYFSCFVVSAARSSIRQLPCRCLLPVQRREAASTADWAVGLNKHGEATISKQSGPHSLTFTTVDMG